MDRGEAILESNSDAGFAEIPADEEKELALLTYRNASY